MNLLIRADGSPAIGLGHVVRCLALAEEWQARWARAYLASARLPEGVDSAITSSGVERRTIAAEPGSLADAVETRELADELAADWIVLDGYSFSDEFEAEVKRGGRPLLVLDDYGHAGHHAADLVLNQNLYADRSLYAEVPDGTRLLLGSRYVLLRQQFRPWRGRQRETKESPTSLLVTLGGGATAGLAPRVLAAMDNSKRPAQLQVVVLAGANAGALEAARVAAKESWIPVKIYPHSPDVTEVMARADLAVSAGGSTCWELAFMGVPTCILSLAEHQASVAESLEAAGAAIHAGGSAEIDTKLPELVMALANDPARRARMSQTGQRLVDGRGAERVVRAMRASELVLREATAADAQLLWTWRNEPGVRDQSFQTGEIPWEDHVRWLDRALGDPNTLLWICAHRDGSPVGQGRFAIRGEEAEISVSLDASWRGRGYGVLLIELLTQRLFAQRPEVTTVRAWIKQSNEASRRSFEAAGYAHASSEPVDGTPAWLYTAARTGAASVGPTAGKGPAT
jgi:UDP-2,4-diacetamido-2,4,6-trideoxy-beta-L-altropyranose hydrolase